MIALLHNKTTQETDKKEYPTKWGSVVPKLDYDLEWYELNYNAVPDGYNQNKHDLVELIELTEQLGEFLKVAVVSYSLVEKTQAVVLENFNNSFGAFIDTAYPVEIRLKDRYYPSVKGALRIEKETALREDRENRESDYLNNNIFPSFEWEW